MTESPRDMLERLKLIASGERECDLSDNDTAALFWLIEAYGSGQRAGEARTGERDGPRFCVNHEGFSGTSADCPTCNPVAPLTVQCVEKAEDELRFQIQRWCGNNAVWREVKASIDTLIAAVQAEEREKIDRLERIKEEKDYSITVYAKELAEAQQTIETLTKMLSQCYELTGADPDGNEPSMLAPYAVAEVKRLRADHDAYEAEVERQNGIRKELLSQVETLTKERDELKG